LFKSKCNRQFSIRSKAPWTSWDKLWQLGRCFGKPIKLWRRFNPDSSQSNLLNNDPSLPKRCTWTTWRGFIPFKKWVGSQLVSKDWRHQNLQAACIGWAIILLCCIKAFPKKISSDGGRRRRWGWLGGSNWFGLRPDGWEENLRMGGRWFWRVRNLQTHEIDEKIVKW
jgi:hypothetical protein